MKMEETIRKKLTDALQPETLHVINESHLHNGHAGDDGSGESHFRVEISSHNFKENGRIGQQREIFDILKDEMQKIHALSIKIH